VKSFTKNLFETRLK